MRQASAPLALAILAEVRIMIQQVLNANLRTV